MSSSIYATAPPARNVEGRADSGVRVALGYVVVTRAVSEQMMCHEGGRALVMSCLRRHQNGDWGDLGCHDAESNESALVTGARVLSSYPIPDDVRRAVTLLPDERLWVITEAENGGGVRSQTTVLYPSDY
jgi:hypothetical protein